MAVEKYAEAVEFIPSILAQNAGLEPIDALVELRSLHEKGEIWSGVNVLKGKISDLFKEGVLEPSLVKKQTIKSATEATVMILRIDDVIAAAPPKEKGKEGVSAPGGGYPGGYY